MAGPKLDFFSKIVNVGWNVAPPDLLAIAINYDDFLYQKPAFSIKTSAGVVNPFTNFKIVKAPPIVNPANPITKQMLASLIEWAGKPPFFFPVSEDLGYRANTTGFFSIAGLVSRFNGKKPATMQVIIKTPASGPPIQPPSFRVEDWAGSSVHESAPLADLAAPGGYTVYPGPNGNEYLDAEVVNSAKNWVNTHNPFAPFTWTMTGPVFSFQFTPDPVDDTLSWGINAYTFLHGDPPASKPPPYNLPLTGQSLPTGGNDWPTAVGTFAATRTGSGGPLPAHTVTLTIDLTTMALSGVVS